MGNTSLQPKLSKDDNSLRSPKRDLVNRQDSLTWTQQGRSLSSQRPARQGKSEQNNIASLSQLKNSIGGEPLERPTLKHLRSEEATLLPSPERYSHDLLNADPLAQAYRSTHAHLKVTRSANKTLATDKLSNRSTSNQRMRLDTSDAEEQDMRVKIYYEGQLEYVTVGWNSRQPNLTVGWLFFETLRTLQTVDGYNLHLIPLITALKNINSKSSEVYDFNLTQTEGSVSLSFIKNGDCLQILYKPQRYQLGGSITSANLNFSPSQSEVQPHKVKTCLEDYDLVKVIGKGGFSKVFQVREKESGKLYAMKTMSKSKIKRDNKVENIQNERSILEKVSHPFIIKMHAAFTNQDYLFLVLDFCAGGELFYKLSHIPNGRMTEKQAKFYFSEILEAIDYLHQNDILYRDLKPENIVIDEQGHIKLTDFGLSKVNFRREHRAYSFCGSPEYMAPEMLATVAEERNRMIMNAPKYHNKNLDFYHLGALLYEMLCGLPPFFSEDRTKMYRDIVHNPIKIPDDLSHECRTLLKGLLQKNPEKRLGCNNGAQEIKAHPWLSDINWSKVVRKEMKPPFKPFMSRSNFDAEYTSMDPILEDDEPLVALQDESPKEQNDISKQPSQVHQMFRQPSIELHERENHTFKDYSFVHHDPNLFHHNSEQMFILPDQSFTDPIGRVQEEFDQSIEHFDANDVRQMMIFQAESKNKQSQLSILSEGAEIMQQNIKYMSNYNSNSAAQNPTKVRLDQNYMSNQPDAHLKQQMSIESQLQQLESTFDYSITKKDKRLDHLAVNANQTQSTMSLFSNPHILCEGNELFTSTCNLQVLREEKKDNKTKPIKQQSKLEFAKTNRKYSPEVDMHRVMLQTQKKPAYGLKHQNSLNDKRPNSTIKGSIIGSTKEKKNLNNYSTSEYHSLGTHLQKKRASEMSLNQKTSPDAKSILRSSIQKSSKGGNFETIANYSSQVSQSSNTMQITSTMKTSQLYSQVHKKVNKKKSRNMESQSSTIKKDTEECKIESNYQTLRLPNKTTEEGEQFIVKQITTNDYLGSFVTANSNREGANDKEMPAEVDREAMVAILLNQSHESCYCSDDEYYSKGNSSSKVAVKNPTKLKYDALEEKIVANQQKHFQANQAKNAEMAKEESKIDIRLDTNTDQKSVSFPQTELEPDGLMSPLSPVNVEAHYQTLKGAKSSTASVIVAMEQSQTLGNSIKKGKKTIGFGRMSSPRGQSILNKTTPISPSGAKSKLKERPSISKASNNLTSSLLHTSQTTTTPKSVESKAMQSHPRLQKTIERITKTQNIQ